MSYLFNNTTPVTNGATVGSFGKNKAVLLTNSDGTPRNVDLFTFKPTPTGSTASTRVVVGASASVIHPIRIWGISFPSQISGSVLS